MDKTSSEAPGADLPPKRSIWSTWWPFAISLVTCPIWWALANLVATRYPIKGAIVLLPLLPLPSAVGAWGGLEARPWVPLTMLLQMPALAFVIRWILVRPHPRRRMVVLAAAYGIAIFLGSPLFWGPSLNDFRAHLRDSAGHGAIDCGEVVLNDSALGSQMNEPRAAALQCAEGAIKAGQPLHVAFQVMGIDSYLFYGLALDSRGKATKFGWDSDVSGGATVAPPRRIWTKSCPTLAVSDDSDPIHCGSEPQ